MNKKCLGCGEVLQTKNPNKKGYVKEEKMLYCERCFRLKNYKEMRMDSLSISNDELLKEAIKFSYPIYYFVDLINLSEEAMSYYHKIPNPKILVLTKVDMIPYSISLDRLINRIKKIYNILEDIYCMSVKKEQYIGALQHRIENEPLKKVVFLGVTNAGKSSCLNALSLKMGGNNYPALISEMPNTTLSFIEWIIKDITIIDAPGFNNQKTDSEILLKSVPKKHIKPITIQTKKETIISIENKITISQDLEKNSITFYGSNILKIEKKYKDIESPKKEITLSVPERTDLVIPGIGFFGIRHACNIKLKNLISFTYETRPSLFGGSDDIN